MKILFQSERLLYRQFILEDAPLLYQLNSDPEVVKYVHEQPTTLENAPSIIKDIIFPQYNINLGRWAVHLKYSEEFIGWCGLKYVHETGDTDLGYRFKRESWGNGYASEAASTCIHYGFTHLGLKRIIARAHINNLASLRVMEKCNMQFYKQEVVDDCPVKTYELLKDSEYL